MKTAKEHTQQSSQDELAYLSELSFEQFGLDEIALYRINKRIDARVFKNGSNTVFISLCCVALISVTCFFVLFNRSQNQPSSYQALLQENNDLTKTLHNLVLPSDTIVDLTAITSNTKNNPIEPFKKSVTIATNTNQQEVDELGNLSIKQIEIPFSEINTSENTNTAFLANAPCVFISDLKIANYKAYYFKQNQFIDLDLTTGLSSQYENERSVQKLARARNSNYYAHVIIQQAMTLYQNQSYANSIEKLQLLYNYNADDVNAQFYIAMGLFEQKQFSKALAFYDACSNNTINVFYQEAEYYKALCLLKTNQTNEAKKLLIQIKNNRTFYSERASSLLDVI